MNITKKTRFLRNKKNKYIGNQMIDRTFRCMLAPNKTGEGIRGSLLQMFFFPTKTIIT
jgi:hypothetical protein